MTEADAPSWRNRPGLVLALCVAVYLPFTLLGYGTDIDVANVLRSGRSWVDDGDYQMSRGPGAAVHELATGVLDGVGRSVAVNLGSVALAALALWSVHELVRRDGGRWPLGAMVVLATNPWFWIAATSLGDFVWALGLALAAAVVARGRTAAASPVARVAAGVLFGLAIGCRGSTVLLVIAWLIAERMGDADGRPSWSATASTAAVAVVVGVVCFVPPWLDAGRTLDFVQNEFDFVGVKVHLGRWAVKNLAVIGVLAGAVLLVGARHLASAGARWRQSTVVRFAILAVVVTEVLYFRFPFKPLHLLPVLAAVALLVGLSPTASRRWVIALVVAQLVGGLVGATFAAPDVADEARSGRFDAGITTGPLLTDVRCRFDDRERGPLPDPASQAAADRAADNAACQNETWRGH